MKAANLHELFPSHITEALQHSIAMFDQEVTTYLLPVHLPDDFYKITLHFLNDKFQLPGFISNSALLHGVEVVLSFLILLPSFAHLIFALEFIWECILQTSKTSLRLK